MRCIRHSTDPKIHEGTPGAGTKLFSTGANLDKYSPNSVSCRIVLPTTSLSLAEPKVFYTSRRTRFSTPSRGAPQSGAKEASSIDRTSGPGGNAHSSAI